ncbi:PTS fructose-like transporter subunit IIB [Anaeromyxobacter oryzae]|uniref:protein-N(pi)-phosphohistidine--D-fructose phosphotransferase n=1 Tax=Anaeromyxobacter oryzae TaxID=2918170 RepID=A0ABM7WPQ7_9BACT|nr:PTS fructose-like transporter subunit IIB [Anaeromyxobacter oryzae]BDG01447.1 PTS fructose transporter subunit IIBC [Anaeromyxobacter oryzae]
MARIVAVTAAQNGISTPFLAAESLRQAGESLGHGIQVEAHGSVGVCGRLSEDAIRAADAVVIAADAPLDQARFSGKRVLVVGTRAAIVDPRAVLLDVLGEALAPAPPAGTAAEPAAPAEGPRDIVAITSCPTGIAHTFMAAEGLEQAAKALGHRIKVETQGSVGARNELSADDIRNAAVVVIAADTKVDKSRFAGKRVYETSTKAAIGHGADVLRTALKDAAATAAGADYASAVKEAKASQTASRTGVYKHLMTGVSYMLPFVVAGGLLIAISFAIGGIYASDDAHRGTLAWALFQVGAKGGFALMIPALAGYIAFSIADRPGLAPGMIGGVVAGMIGAGFLGGLAAGFIAGYGTRWLNGVLRLPRNLEGLKPTLLLPLGGTLIVGLLMLFVVGAPVALLLRALETWLKGMQSGSAAGLGALLGAMMAFDMGGPVNKAAYAFSTGLIASQVYRPMAAVMVAGMTPPLGVALATWLFRNRFTKDEREAGKAAGVLGLSFITEGAIPFAARDPLRVIPALMLGSAIAGALSMAAGVELRVPHGGAFVLPIPNAVTHVGIYLVALVAGSVATALMLRVTLKPVV